MARLTRAGLAVALGALVALGTPIARADAAPDDNCVTGGSQDAQASLWAQQLLGADQTIGFARAGGQRIALLDSGVDANQPQLRGRVESGYDAVAGHGHADTDCLGTGTEVAGLMVAKKLANAGLTGLAPAASVVPIRVLDSSNNGSAPVVAPSVLAKGINWAVSAGVDVICVDTAIYVDDPAVAGAVESAGAHNIPVVAAVGDKGDDNGGNPTPYPARYSGVIGVSAIDRTGARWSGSGHGSYVDLAAPGVSMLVTQRVQGLTSATGTALAAGLVAASAALVRSRLTSLSWAQVGNQLRATASPAAAGPHSLDVGVGVLNPFAALTEQPAASGPAKLPAFAPPTLSAAQQRRADAWTSSRRLAMVLAGVAIGVVLLVLLAGLAIPRGRRRSWRPTVAAPLPHRVEPTEPAPPALLFDEL